MRFSKTLAALGIACALVALMGCVKAPAAGGEGSSTLTQSSSAANQSTTTDSSSSATAGSNADGTMRMADYMSERYASFDAFDAGIADGSSVPQSLSLWKNSKDMGHIYDAESITRMWNALKQVRIRANEPTPKKDDAETLSFSFDSGRECIVFSFETCEYASFSGDEMYPVENPKEVLELAEELNKLAQKNAPQVGSELPNDNGAYLWDANGDGSLEHMWLDFVDNGDEAMSATSVYVFGGDIDAQTYIEGAYGIESVKLAEDDQGPYVILRYSWGSPLSDATESNMHTCTIRLVGNELKVEETTGK